jgi:hypothetical protein
MISESLKAELIVPDATDMPWLDKSFDLVVDIECLMACSHLDTKKFSL